MILYHGTNVYFDEFSNDFISTEKSVDQYGSGFYFYSVKSKTAMHGSLRVYADVDIKKPIEFNNKKKLTKQQVYKLLIASPNLEERLSNFGDIEHEGFELVLNYAIKQYVGMQFLTGLNVIGNDFFQRSETHILLKEFKKITKIDCITDMSRDIYVVLTKNQITIKKVVHEQEDEDE